MKHYESTLAKIADQVFRSTDLNETKALIVSHLESTRVKDKDKMISDISQLTNLTRVKFCFTNMLLAFEGMRVNKKVA